MPHQLISGLILAGGRGSRMQMQDKGLIEVNGKTLIQQRIDSLTQQVSTILISANNNIKTYQQYGFPVVQDADTEFKGPLAGLEAGWRHCATDWLISCPCDTPLLATDYVVRMSTECNKQDKHIAVAHSGDRLQNTFVLMHRTVSTSISLALASQCYAVHKWLTTLDFCQVDFSDYPEMFINFNTADDIERYVNNT